MSYKIGYELVIFDWDGTLMEQNDLLYASALPLLQHLKDVGVKLAVATGKDYRSLVHVFAEQGYAQYFDTFRTSDQTRNKPDPLMLEEILDELNTPLSKALMVGDSVYDLEMAKRIGMSSVGLTTGGCLRDVLASYHPIKVIDDLSELRSLVIKNK